MKIISALRSRAAGFTMIELLIVISILGILAVAVLSAINPIEQINRGRDTGSRSDAEQLLNAIERFHAFQGFYPWTDGVVTTYPVGGATGRVVDDTWATTTQPVGSTQPCLLLTRLGSVSYTDGPCVNTDELKLSFNQRLNNQNYNDLYIYNRGNTGDSTYVCFDPQSNAFRQEATTRCGAGGAGLPSDLQPMAAHVCPSGGNPNWHGSAGRAMICLP